MPAERPIQLPEPQKSGQSYVISQAFYDKLKEADLGFKIIPKPEDFTVEKSGGELRFSINPNGPVFQGLTGSSCTGFKLTNTGAAIRVATGQAGSQILAETTVAYGTDIWAVITLNGTTGTYTAALATSFTASDTTAGVLIGSSNAAGIISQVHCGLISVTVCRNYFAAAAPFYGFTVS